VSTDSGYINYKGRVYTGLFSPPRCILTSGILEIDGKKISLDVSGIANPWVKPEELDAGDVHVDVSPDGKRHGAKSGDKVPGERSGEVAVFFTKGGADDHLVTWAIQGDASLRISIENRDFPAEWQEGYSLVKKIQERIMRQETELKLSVPASGEAGQVPRRPGELVINVSKDGTMEFGGKTVDAKVLKEKLTEIAKIDRKRAIIIRAEKDVPYKEIVSVLDLTHVAGLYHVSFATNTQEKE
jgi:biopolymer transport protein ExbD